MTGVGQGWRENQRRLCTRRSSLNISPAANNSPAPFSFWPPFLVFLGAELWMAATRDCSPPLASTRKITPTRTRRRRFYFWQSRTHAASGTWWAGFRARVGTQLH